jgi:competence protein ComEC
MDNRILNFIWNNLAISMAAQLTTVPLILFYFQTSSSLSIIGNFLFVPISSLLLYCLLLFLILPNFWGLQSYLAKGITVYINAMNKAIEVLFNLLQFGEQQYHIGVAGLVYYYYILFLGIYWIQHKAPNCLILLLLGTCIYSLQKLFSF